MSMHPALEFDLVHENGPLLLRCRTSSEARKKLTYPSKQAGRETGGTMSVAVGQKIPYVSFAGAKQVVSHWFRLFGGGSVIHIIRDPEAAVDSQVRTFGKDRDSCRAQYSASVGRVSNYLSGLPYRIKTVRFEDLIAKPVDVMTEIYGWMGQEVPRAVLDKILTTKDPWTHRGKFMCGLRYFTSVGKQRRQ